MKSAHLAVPLLIVPLLAMAAPASAAIVINEVESQPNPDWVELKNTGAGEVNVGGWVISDSQDDNDFIIPADTMIAAGGLHVADTLGFGLSNPDAIRLFDGGTQVDGHAWTPHAYTTYGRCPAYADGFVTTVSVTKGAENDCPTRLTAWPGAGAVSLADEAFAFNPNLSGLTYQPSGTAARGVLWASFNNLGSLYRLVHDGAKWVRDSTGGWGPGKSLRYPTGFGNPDAEGVTLAGGDRSGIFVATERDGDNDTVSRPTVLRYDVTSPDAILTATKEWNLTADLPPLPENDSLEAIAWVPDSVLVAKGFVDANTAAAYDPTTYPNHGAGLFLVGVEQGGEIVAYALDQTPGGGFTRVAAFPSGFPTVMDLEFEPETGLLWAACDDSCNGRTKRLDVAQTGVDDGKYVVQSTYEPPSGMSHLFNNEGFAIAPRAECSGSLKPVFWADDSSTGGHAIREGRLSCTNPPPPDDGEDDEDTQKPVTPVTTTTTPTATTTTTLPPRLPFAGPPAAIDRTKPVFSRLRASRSRVQFTLSEASRVTITVERRSGRRFRRLRRFTVAAARGARTVSFRGRVPAGRLRSGRLRITVQAIDAGGNRSAATRRLVPS